MDRSNVFSQIKSGKPRNEIYTELVDKGNGRESIAKLLANVPSTTGYASFKFLNTLLGILMLFMALSGIGSSFQTVIINGFLAYAVFSYRIKYYPWISAVYLFMLIVMAFLAFAQPEKMNNLLIVVITSSTVISSLFLSIYLYLQLYKKPKEERVLYQNENGENRSYTEYIFED